MIKMIHLPNNLNQYHLLHTFFVYKNFLNKRIIHKKEARAHNFYELFAHGVSEIIAGEPGFIEGNLDSDLACS